MACIYHEKENTPHVVIFTCGFRSHQERNHTAFERRLFLTYGFQFGAHPGTPKCNGCGLSALARGLRDSGELRLPPKGAVLSLALLLVRCLR